MQRWNWSLLLVIGVCLAGFNGCASLKLPGKEPTFGSSAAAGTTCAAPDPIVDAEMPTFGFGKSDDKAEGFDGKYALGRLCERRGEIDQAEHIYNVLLEKKPNDANLHHRLGVLAVKKNDFAKAEECFRKAQSLAPASAELFSDIGYCYYLQLRFAEAEAMFHEALKIDPNHAQTINNMALVLGRQGRCDEALELFKRTNKESEAYANLAYILAQNGDFAKAEQLYLHALTLDNEMKAAAEAVLQINQREQARSRLESANLGPMAAAPITPVDGTSEQLVRLPKTEL